MAQEAADLVAALGRLETLETHLRGSRRRIMLLASVICVMIVGLAIMCMLRIRGGGEPRELRVFDEHGAARATIETRSDGSVALLLTDSHGVACATLTVTGNGEPKLELNEGGKVAHVLLGVRPSYLVTSGIADIPGQSSGGFMAPEEAYVRLVCGNGRVSAGMDATSRGWGNLWLGGHDQGAAHLSPARLELHGPGSTRRATLDTVGLEHTVLQLFDKDGKMTWSAP